MLLLLAFFFFQLDMACYRCSTEQDHNLQVVGGNAFIKVGKQQTNPGNTWLKNLVRDVQEVRWFTDIRSKVTKTRKTDQVKNHS